MRFIFMIPSDRPYHQRVPAIKAKMIARDRQLPSVSVGVIRTAIGTIASRLTLPGEKEEKVEEEEAIIGLRICIKWCVRNGTALPP